MGLQNLLSTQGSPLSKNNGGPNSILRGSSQQSELHATPTGDGSYSLNGSNFSTVNAIYQEYDDGAPNLLPAPSVLDTNGITPLSSLRDASATSLNNTFAFGTYRAGAPAGSFF